MARQLARPKGKMKRTPSSKSRVKSKSDPQPSTMGPTLSWTLTGQLSGIAQARRCGCERLDAEYLEYVHGGDGEGDVGR
jgi:hypothetical protein